MLKIFESFAGYGSQSIALRNIGVPFKAVGISEIDKYAIKAYQAIHGNVTNFGDISKINWKKTPNFDLFTYSFPCQAISTAGMMKGLKKDSGTTSSLLWECMKPIEIKAPKYLLLENVKNLVSKKFSSDFQDWQDYLKSQGYTNFTKVLNAKDFGIPQNRERVFMVSIHGNVQYKFPQKQLLTKCLGDVLESKVADKYYLSDKRVKGFTIHSERHAEKGNGFVFKLKKLTDNANSITTRAGSRSTDNFIDTGYDIPSFSHNNKVIQINKNKESGGRQPYQDNRIYDQKGISPTVMCTTSAKVITNNHRIRRLTPMECFRLMGVSDNDFQKVKNVGISDTQLYKLAGNSIVVPVLEGIFKNLNMKLNPIKID